MYIGDLSKKGNQETELNISPTTSGALEQAVGKGFNGRGQYVVFCDVGPDIFSRLGSESDILPFSTPLLSLFWREES